MKKQDWYKDAVVYQIYPKSFCDSNGDGIGDIRGIISKLDYIKDLGVNTVWLSPCYPSPQADNGYDISDYQDIAPEYGTLEDFKEMLDEMHKRGIRLLMDLVVNHTSDEHRWFKEALKGKDNPYRDYYVWRDPVDGHVPNDWEAGFEKSAWEYDEASGQYWLHLFTEKQPDLNWENPKLREEIVNMINWWLDMGVDGFRCDVINLIAKDYDAVDPGDGIHLHKYLHELNEKCFKPHNAMTVGEVFGLSPEQSLMLTAPEREELTLVFQFEHMRVGRVDGQRFFHCDFEPHKFVDVLAKWQNGLNGRGWNALCYENHDQPRSLNRFGSPHEYRRESAKMLATLLYCMQGTPFIYEGQELGCINPVFHSLYESVDCEANDIERHLVETYGMEETLRKFSFDSRDCGRVPMAWDDSYNGGFTTGKPWIKLNDFYREINAEKELSSENGVYDYYKKLLSLRASKNVLLRGDFELIKNEDGVVIYRRTLEDEKDIYVVLNYSSDEIQCTVPNGTILLSNYNRVKSGVDLTLAPWEAVVIEK